MATLSVSSDTPSDNPAADPEILARLFGITEISLRVGIDRPLGAVSIDIVGLGSNYSGILAPEAALDLAHKLIAACARLRRGEGEPGAGPLSSTF
jgi:hypothetical protein